MTTFLAAYAALMTRALFYALTALLILALVSAAAMAADTITALPTGPAPAPEVPTITLWRDGAIMLALVVAIGVIVWRASLIERWVRSRIEFHGLAAALIEDELLKRGVVKPVEAAPTPEPTIEPIKDPWEEEADKVAPPPVAARRVAPVQLTPKQMAAKLTPRTRTRGHA